MGYAAYPDKQMGGELDGPLMLNPVTAKSIADHIVAALM
jgi:hypothetical protein